MLRLCEDFWVGDTHAVLDYVEFYEREFGRVVRSVRHVVGPAAEDIAQEAFIAAFDQWDDVTHLDLPVAWVNKVAHRIAWRSAQRERARAEIERHGSSAQVPSARDLDLISRRSPTCRIAMKPQCGSTTWRIDPSPTSRSCSAVRSAPPRSYSCGLGSTSPGD